MGQGKTGVSDSPARLEEDVQRSRQHLDAVIAELDQRRHRLLDVRAPVRSHAVGILRRRAERRAISGWLY